MSSKASAPGKSISKKKPPAEPVWEEATISEEGGVRYLHLGTPWVQGAMRVRKPQAIELEYVQRMMVWLLWRPLSAWRNQRAVQLGLGAGAITRFCHKKLRMRTTAVEINPTVIGVCRAWFHLPEDDERLQVLNEDAAQFVADPEQAGTVDALCVDLYDHDAASPVLDDDDFYAGCYRLLTDDGVMTVNLFGRNASFDNSAARIAKVFGERVAQIKATKEGNTIVVAWKGKDLPEREVLAGRADTIADELGLPARKWVKLLGSLQI